MKASSSSFPEIVENDGDVISVDLAVDWSRHTPASGVIEELVWFCAMEKPIPVAFPLVMVTAWLGGVNE
jgi:hypothetical protein